MEGSSNNRERRRYPRVFIDLPAGYRDANDSCIRGAIVVNASKGGFLIESPRDLPVGTELSVTVLFPKGFKLTNFKAVAEIVWKKPYSKQDLKGNQYWKGYQYGLEFIQMFGEDRWKLDLLIGGRFESEKNPPSQSYQP